LHGPTVTTLQPFLERLITIHPFRTPDRLLLWILLRGCMVTLYVNLFYHEGYGETPKDFPPP
ncbi:MAG: hypothetical protein ACLP9L_02160, partial [Thermoguttaceae bacterium]